MTVELTDIPHEVTLEAQISIVKVDLQMWINTRFQMQIRHRVNKTLGNEEAAKSLTEELVKIEKTINEYTNILDGLIKEGGK